jgi:hypothetical protein
MQRATKEKRPWDGSGRAPAAAHDAEQDDVEDDEQDNYFSPGRFYCVELMVRPCGMPIAWDLFDKSESPSKIVNFIERHHPTIQDKFSYYCVDKGCQILRHLLASKRWEDFRHSSRIIVDAYHYRNHRTDDFICRKYCNPAPLNGSAPNLVVEVNDGGVTKFKRAFNTIVSHYLSQCSIMLTWNTGL